MRCKQIATLSGGKWDKLHDISRRVYSPYGLSPTIHTCGGGQQEPKVLIMKNGKVRIRKLTPLECWRLMGFDDDDFRKAEKQCSNTQLYKQAGNSIVVDCLEGILRNLLLSKEQRSPAQKTNKELLEWLDDLLGE